MRPSLVLRLAVILAITAFLVPVQLLALRGGWPLAGRLPVGFHRLLLRLLRVRIEVIGRPPANGDAALILSNHVSWLDIPVLAALIPLSFIAKSEIAGWPLVGFLAKLQRCIFVDRARKTATAEVNGLVAGRLGAGDVIVLFPEGTTGDGIRLLPFRSSLVGAARAALIAHEVEAIRLQPVAIVYTRRRGLPITRREMPDVAWYGDMELGRHLARFIRGGPIDVAVAWGEPILLDAGIDRKQATAAAERAVRDGIARLRSGGTRDRGGDAVQGQADRPSLGDRLYSPSPMGE